LPAAVTIDTVAPILPNVLSDASVVDGKEDGHVNLIGQVISGTAEANSFVTLFDNVTFGTGQNVTTTSVVIGSGYANSQGTFSITTTNALTAQSGIHTIRATATDAAGNVIRLIFTEP